MPELKASPDIIVVDNEADEKNGSVTIEYVKEQRQELWEIQPGADWERISFSIESGEGDEVQLKGAYNRILRPGEVYEAGIFEEDKGPLSDPSNRLAHLRVVCLWKKPEERDFITEAGAKGRGAWSELFVATSIPTSIVFIGVSQQKPILDDTGIPHLEAPEGEPTITTSANTHRVEIKPLMPGNNYFLVVVVADTFGNWEVWQTEFITFRRKLTVEFPTLHILNDGDPGSVGEGEFWFEVFEGDQIVQGFHLPTQDIDDWNETDRPYSVGFAHLGVPRIIAAEKWGVKVRSRGTEHDGVLEADEGAWGEAILRLPVGEFETVTNRKFTMDCPHSTTGDDFHYKVDVRWSVEYLP